MRQTGKPSWAQGEVEIKAYTACWSDVAEQVQI